MKGKIIEVRKTVSLDPRKKGKEVLDYTYMFDNLGPFYFEIEEKFDRPEVLKEAMREKKRELEEKTYHRKEKENEAHKTYNR